MASTDAAALPNPDGPLHGRTALVTGGAGGIGLACARLPAAQGAVVTIADLDGDRASAAAAETGGRAWQVDLSRTRALDDLVLEVDILVNNAGVQRVSPIQDFPPDDFLLIRAALPHMYRGGFGRVVNISSVHGLVASPFKSAYVAAKHGLCGHRWLSDSAIKRPVEPAEVAALVGWLVGPDASMVTGASYTMDGGWMAR